MARTKQIDPNVAVSQWRLVARRFRREKLAIAALIFLGLLEIGRAHV